MAEGKRLFPQLDPALVESAVTAYLKAGIWNVNGHLTAEAADFSLKFYAKAGTIKDKDLRPELYYDFGPLNAVLKKIGEK